MHITNHSADTLELGEFSESIYVARFNLELGRENIRSKGGSIMQLVKKATTLTILVFALIISGCAWQRIPAAPSYVAPPPLPFRVGVVLDNTQGSAYFGPGIVNLWKEMRVFEAVTYPYREGDPVDGVLRLTINGGWKGHGAGAGVLIGLTLGLASSAVGPNMVGVHDAAASLSKDAREVARYTVRVESTVTWGMGANTTDVSNKADDLQRRKLAIELAQKLEADRSTLVKAFSR